MTDTTQVRDRDLMLAGDGREHTRECVEHGWWLLDWETACLDQGVPPGGPVASHEEIHAFVLTLTGGA